MPEPYEFTDSTDWLSTPLAALAPLESSLRCQVCKDFFTTPMMTSCSHTFCSLCIRRYLSQEGRCPACRESDQEIKLRRNWVLEELVANFTASRRGLLEFARRAAEKTLADDDNGGGAAESQRPKKRRKVANDHKDNTVPNGTTERRSTRSQSKKLTASQSQQSAAAPSSTPESVIDVIKDSEEEGSLYKETGQRPTTSHSPPSLANGNGSAATEPNDGLVACPCCHRRMKETLINSHLDKCILGESTTPVDGVGGTTTRTSSPAPGPAPIPPQIAAPGTIAYTQKKPAKQIERLPFINYSLLTDNALRKKLRDLGIPTHGSRELMRRRHTEWVNLWNANCDSTNPVSKRQLLHELKVWEDTLGRQGDKGTASGFMAKDFDRDNYVKNQKNNFDDLIKQARQRRAVASDRPPPTADNGTPSAAEEHNGASDQGVKPQDHVKQPDGRASIASIIMPESPNIVQGGHLNGTDDRLPRGKPSHLPADTSLEQQAPSPSDSIPSRWPGSEGEPPDTPANGYAA
ncbi:E3 ubiquitin-protein ligase rad18 [Exophiala dermatitidis]|uniref:Postreplication repair E3 ubiquitin-protein ligase RAD18 n=1 Tax=Exophiala dermatitidis TaxID=5970 RepID=A0AAN6IRA6_EXODE|nr:E3 ubiquitin-protein ligase rad18 [Exophiala dermatitidis]KAJ4507206.1 E3 ubiquitin-protein ligase rad18 [Exophiala dermatitidis]KAJ4517319.1 E3 ubiquitin-protein ligase rad18 [Exophiala dermatitidis]KAJ4548935.1 E3 ubiquitin-protein ligase rad18 [Exophiala dermatitidis]KAJ4550707.1 E3 ubiquitin-protein ligase rad18 [Exophiala dermatitidis]